MFIYFDFRSNRLIRFLTLLAGSVLIYWTYSLKLNTMSSNENLISVDFEVFGRVQGVFFRKYTEQQAKRLGLKGWCMNTQQDTVKGVLEGNPAKVNEMKQWLEKTGSPQSSIDKAVFTNEKTISSYTIDTFKIKR